MKIWTPLLFLYVNSTPTQWKFFSPYYNKNDGMLWQANKQTMEFTPRR